VADGLVSPERARQDYAVAVCRVDGGFQMDAEATVRLRAAS
jgi:hypothetical protein